MNAPSFVICCLVATSALAAPPTGSDAAPAPAPAVPIARVHLEANSRQATLVRYLGSDFKKGIYVDVTTYHFERVCTAPCDADVSASADEVYGVIGSNLMPSNTVSFEGVGGPVTLTVDAKPKDFYYRSILEIVGGSAVAFFSGALYVFSRSDEGLASAIPASGIVLPIGMVAGVALAAFGYYGAFHSQTRVEVAR